MARATAILPKGDWTGDAADTLVLTIHERCQQTGQFRTVSGAEILFAHDRQTALRSGDALKLEDGRVVDVLGAPEPLLELRGEGEALLEFVWACGNRHVPVELRAGRIRVLRTALPADMRAGLAFAIREIEAPFDPIGLPYIAAKHHHAHGHDHGHHDHGHHHHDDGCGCGHDHKHGHDHSHHDHHYHGHHHHKHK